MTRKGEGWSRTVKVRMKAKPPEVCTARQLEDELQSVHNRYMASVPGTAEALERLRVYRERHFGVR